MYQFKWTAILALVIGITHALASTNKLLLPLLDTPAASEFDRAIAETVGHRICSLSQRTLERLWDASWIFPRSAMAATELSHHVAMLSGPGGTYRLETPTGSSDWRTFTSVSESESILHAHARALDFERTHKVGLLSPLTVTTPLYPFPERQRPRIASFRSVHGMRYRFPKPAVLVAASDDHAESPNTLQFAAAWRFLYQDNSTVPTYGGHATATVYSAKLRHARVVQGTVQLRTARCGEKGPRRLMWPVLGNALDEFEAMHQFRLPSGNPITQTAAERLHLAHPSCAVGRVHLSRLVPAGTRVAVKVQPLRLEDPQCEKPCATTAEIAGLAANHYLRVHQIARFTPETFSVYFAAGGDAPNAAAHFIIESEWIDGVPLGKLVSITPCGPEEYNALLSEGRFFEDGYLAGAMHFVANSSSTVHQQNVALLDTFQSLRASRPRLEHVGLQMPPMFEMWRTRTLVDNNLDVHNAALLELFYNEWATINFGGHSHRDRRAENYVVQKTGYPRGFRINQHLYFVIGAHVPTIRRIDTGSAGACASQCAKIRVNVDSIHGDTFQLLRDKSMLLLDPRNERVGDLDVLGEVVSRSMIEIVDWATDTIRHRTIKRLQLKNETHAAEIQVETNRSTLLALWESVPHPNEADVWLDLLFRYMLSWGELAATSLYALARGASFPAVVRAFYAWFLQPFNSETASIDSAMRYSTVYP